MGKAFYLIKRLFGSVSLVLAWICELFSSLFVLELDVSFIFVLTGTILELLNIDQRLLDFFDFGGDSLANKLDLLEFWVFSLFVFQALQIFVLLFTSIDKVLGGKQRRLSHLWVWQPLLDNRGLSQVNKHSYLNTYGRSRETAVRCEDTFEARRSRLHALLRVFTIIPAYVFVALIEIFVSVFKFIAWLEIAVSGRLSRVVFSVLAAGIRIDGRFNAYYYMMTDRYPPISGRDRPDYPFRITVCKPPPRFNRLHSTLRPVIGLRSFVLYKLYVLWLEILTIPILIRILITGKHSKRLFEEQTRSERFALNANAYFSYFTELVPIPEIGAEKQKKPA